MPDGEEEFAADWKRLAAHARLERSDLVILPEMPFHHWFAAAPRFRRRTWDEAVAAHERWMGRLVELTPAAVLGSRPVNRRGTRHNKGFFWTEERGGEAVHQKRYLPNEEGYHEASWYSRGDGRFALFRAAKCRAGMMICSDLWAMPKARAYGKKGAHLIAVPYAAPRASVPRWLAAGKVAAVISGAFCAASNRSGERDGVTFGGTGWVIGPDGKVLGLTTAEAPFVTVDVDPRVADAAKRTYPRDALLPD
jgi:N-carbamoylputrescine amidase